MIIKSSFRTFGGKVLIKMDSWFIGEVAKLKKPVIEILNELRRLIEKLFLVVETLK